MVRTFKIYFLSKFQACDASVLTIVYMLCIIQNLHNCKFLPFDQHPTISTFPVSDNHHFTVSMSSTFLDLTNEWYHADIFLCLAYFTYHKDFKIFFFSDITIYTHKAPSNNDMAQILIFYFQIKIFSNFLAISSLSRDYFKICLISKYWDFCRHPHIINLFPLLS